MTLKPRSHVRILKYRTRAISAQKLLCTKFADPVYSGFLFSNQPIKIIDLKVTKKTVKPVKPTKNSTRPYLNEIPAHFIYEIKTKGYDAICVNVFPTS